MAGKVRRGFLYYVFVFLAFVVGVFCILTAILIFNPGKDIYGLGIRYESYKHDKTYYDLSNEENTKISSKDIKKVKFNSGYTDFTISYANTESFIKVVLEPRITALTKNETTVLEPIITFENDTLTIDMQEPKLYLGFSKQARINLVCPQGKDFSNLDFEINTNSGSLVLGDASLFNYKVKSINLTTKTGAVTLNNNVDITSGNVTINTQKSKINIGCNVKTMLDITNVGGRINVGDITGSLKLTNTDSLAANCENISGDVYLTTTNGYFIAKSVNNISTPIDSDNTNVVIDKVNGNINCTLKAGDLTIGELVGNSLVNATSGVITIKKAQGTSHMITTTSGKVTLSQSGNSITTIETESGEIDASFTESVGTVTLTSKKSATIKINTKSALAYYLTYTTKKGITTSWSTEKFENSGTMEVFGATAESTSQITASTNGKIVLKEII